MIHPGYLKEKTRFHLDQQWHKATLLSTTVYVVVKTLERFQQSRKQNQNPRTMRVLLTHLA